MEYQVIVNPATKPATPLPWHSEECVHGGEILVRPGGTQSHLQIVPALDAAYIVHVCNAYPKLVEVLRHLVNMAMTRDDQAREDALCTARALLAKLEAA